MNTRYSKSASRALLRCNKRQLVREKIEAYAQDPESVSANVVKLQGREEYCLRVQDWRVVVELMDDAIVIIDIAPRGSVYEVKK
jgi:mRNA interferase RelE/StbE